MIIKVFNELTRTDIIKIFEIHTIPWGKQESFGSSKVILMNTIYDKFISKNILQVI